MLVSLRKICTTAERLNLAVGSFNIVNLASLKAVTAAAEELDLPVILQFAQCHEELNRLEDLGPLMVRYAKEAQVPVCVHLDHGEDLEYLKKALDLGFSGIMFDGSALPYEENVRLSAKAVELAESYGAGVEAELGSMGRRESGAGDHTGSDDETKIYTDPSLAKEFVEQTGIDALACSFGTTHGIYLTEPKLSFEVVRRVRELTDGIPVVMHGGSGVSPEDYRRAIESGVRKINYFTYMDKAGGSAARDYLDECKDGPAFYTALSQKAEEAMKWNVKNAMRLFMNH